MISILIPVYNEEEVLERSVTRLHDYLVERGFEHEIIVSSNGSTDRTPELCQELERRFDWFRSLILKDRGVGTAFAAAVKKAQSEHLISLDVDLSSELTFIDFAVNLLQFADMVVGSKTMGSQRRSFFRVLGSQMYILFTQLSFDLTISDYSIGVKAYRKSSILGALDHLDSWTGYVFELCLFLRKRGKRIIQVGIECEDKRKSRFNILHEGVYRYYHLFRCFQLLRDPDSWLYQN